MLNLRNYFIKEHVGMMKLHEAYDILDPESGEMVAQAIEEASGMKKLLKLFLDKRMHSKV